MELNPEDVKAEIAAVKVAFAEVNARLGRGRGKPGGVSRPNILSRVSKAVAAPAGDRPQQPVRSYSEYDRRSSRRFVNRDWNIARKRTAEGLFVDDQEDAAIGVDDQEHEGTRSNAHGPELERCEKKPSRPEPGTGSRPTSKRDSEPYDPFNEANKPSEHSSQPQQIGRSYALHKGEASVRSGRPFDQSRISFSSHLQRRNNSRHHQTGWPGREHEEAAAHGQTGVGHKRRADTDIRGESKMARADQTSHSQPATALMEDGEVEPQPPLSQAPKEEFIVEKRPERQAPVPDKVLQRNRRMFGALLGHLDGAERQEKKFEQSEIMKRRKELEEHAAERARINSIQAREAERRRQFEARRKDIATKRELLLQQNMKQAKLLCAEKIAYARGLLQFIRTETIPPILWEPAAMNTDVEKLFEQQEQDFQSWAAEQLDKLKLDQQGMRERAEKQWAEIDRIREERHNANLGRWKGAAGAATAHPKAVKSSVMTAKEFRERVQQIQPTGIAEADAPEQPGNDDDQDHAEDDEEAHDEAYLLPDVETLASEPTELPDNGPSRSDRSATPHRHVGTGGIDGEIHNAHSHSERQENETLQSTSDHEADKAGVNEQTGLNGIDPGEGFEQPGDNSDDSLSLSE